MIILLLFLFSFSIQAEIFQWVDANGNQHYSDKVQQGAELVQVDPGYSYYQVKKVYDGDTVLLSNNKKIRLLGINTPEVESRHKSAQPGAEEAKQWLLMRLKNHKVRLETDVEKKDKYGRVLAYLFTQDKRHINLELVSKGLASVNIHPPNLKYSDDLLHAQNQAEQDASGIWNYPEYQPKQEFEITKSNYKGWQRIIGRVENIRHTRKYSYLDLSDTFSLKVKKNSLHLFPDLNNYVGKKIEVRGWINKNKNRYSMVIRHPSAIH